MSPRFASFVCLIMLASANLFAQQWSSFLKTVQEVAQRTDDAQLRFLTQKADAVSYAQAHTLPVETVLPSGNMVSLQSISKGYPQYYYGISLNSAQTARSNMVWSGGGLGLSLNGSGQTLGVWDEARVRNTHQEFSSPSRVTQGDNPSSISNHATHVSGTMIAQGVYAAAKGMSNAASIRAYDWNNDEAEMRTAAGQNNVRTSNHSYGYVVGWIYNFRGDGNWVWLGNPTVSATQDYRFGLYTSTSAAWDNVARDYPYYLICKAAGNDRGEGPAPGTQHWVWQNNTWTLSTVTRDKDGGSAGYDCIEGTGLSKNVLTVGAVNYVASYSSPASVTMSSFSGWGPTDDGRIKPDVVAMGVSELSSVGSADNAYSYYSGTSMATPAVTGSIGLLLHHHQNLKPNASPMRSSSVKGLIIHTADETGDNPGPDYKYGWGLINTARAAQVISYNAARSENWDIQERSLQNGQTITISGISAGSAPIKVTICWTDPAGSPPSATLNPTTLMLKNDLDVRLQRNGASTIYYPWILNPANPSAAASTGDNTRDNVEQVYIVQPTAGTYTITINHKGTLLNSAAQVVSIIISGLEPPSLIANAGEDKVVCPGSAAVLSGSATGGNGSISYQWTIAGTSTVVGTAATLTVTPSQTTTFRLTATSGALTASDDAIVNVAALPTANAGSDKTITAGQTTTLTAASNSGTVQYIWKNLATNQAIGTTQSITVQPFSTTAYQLGVTNAQQCTKLDTIVVNVTPVTVRANAGADRIVCPNATVSIQGSGQGAGTLSYQWRDLSTNSVLATTQILSTTIASSRNLELKVTDQANGSATDTVRINVIGNGWQPTISPQSSTCRNRQVRYNAPYISGASYQWNCSNGQIVSGGSSYSCVIQWNNSGTTAIVGVSMGINGCFTAKVDTLTLQIQPAPYFTVSNACVNDTKVYTTSNTNGSSFQWSLPNGGGSIISGAGTNAISVNWTAAGGTSVRVEETNAAGCKASLTKTLTVYALPTPSISVNNSDAPRVGDTRIYSLSANSGRSYQWTVNGGTITQGQGTNAITVSWANPGDASVTVVETISNVGCSGTATVNVYVSQSFGLDEQTALIGGQSAIFPNPAKDYLNITLPVHDEATSLLLTVSSLEGKELMKQNEKAVGGMLHATMDIQRLPAGSYTLSIRGGSIVHTLRFVKQ